MKFLRIEDKNGYRIITLDRGRGNPLNMEMVREIRNVISDTDNDPKIGGAVINGKKGFFSVGLDLIELYGYDEDEIELFWREFLGMKTDLAMFKKPLVAAVTGHAPAGGCVIAIGCDFRVMAKGNYKIGLNEIPVGIVVPESIFHLYSFWLGQATAYQFLLEGKLVDPEEALKVNMVDMLTEPEAVLESAEHQLMKYLKMDPGTWIQSKQNLRRDLLSKLETDMDEMIAVATKQWWSPQIRALMGSIVKSLKK